MADPEVVNLSAIRDPIVREVFEAYEREQTGHYLRMRNVAELLRAARAETEFVRAAVAGPSTCEHCNGTRFVHAHADDCTDDLCALNGDMHSCAGKVEPCDACAPPAASDSDARRVQDLAAIVRQLLHLHRHSAAGGDARARAGAYLKRHGLAGSPLRSPAPPTR